MLTLVRTVVNLRVVPRRRPRLPRRFPLVSIVVPARDEERTIGRAVSGLLAQTWPALEVVVVNDRSKDATGAILERLSADPRLKVVTGAEPPEGWLGKPWALHQGSRQAAGELLLFVDADVIYSPDAVTAAVAHMDETDAGLLSLLPHMEMRGFWEHVILSNLAFFAYAVLPLWAANRSKAPLLALGGGPGNLVRRAAYEAAGGHEPLRDAVIDDVGLARSIRRSGYRTEIVRADELISIRMYHGGREAVDGFTKNAFAAFHRSYAGVIGTILLGIVAHMLPYGLAVTGDAFAIGTVVLISSVRALIFRSCHYRMDNALLGHPLMMLAWLWIMVRSMWITGIRGRLHWRGRSYDAGRTRFG